MDGAVKAAKRTRRADKAQQTRQRIIDAATRLFLERGYVPTTIEAIAEAADVAVETVYARFRNKTSLMVAVKDAAEPSQSRQLEMAAALSRGMLQRISPVYAVLRDAAAADSALRGPLTADINRRRDFQRTLAEIVHARGPFRGGLTTEPAAETYSALANPDLYLLLTTHHRWTANQYQAWLARSLRLLLLPEP